MFYYFRYLVFFIGIILPSLSFSMDPPKWMKKAQKKAQRTVQAVQQSVQQGVHWVENAGNILLGNIAATPEILLKTIDFALLPKDIQKIIIDLIVQSYNAASLQEATFAIKSLSLVNKDLSQLINNSSYCFNMVKHLGQRFSTFDRNVYRLLNTPQAQQQLKNSEELMQLIRLYMNYSSEFSLNDIGNFINMHHINVNFTFSGAEPSPLTIAIQHRLLPLVQLLLNKGADPFLVIPGNQTPFFLAASLAETNDTAMNILKVLIKKLPAGAIDWYDESEFNILCYAILEQHPKTVKILLEYGADPEFNNGVPVIIAQQINNQEIIDLLNNAIQKKQRK